MYIYMDGLIVDHRDPRQKQILLRWVLDLLRKNGLRVVPNKIQQVALFRVLGAELTLTRACPLKSRLDIPSQVTLNSAPEYYGGDKLAATLDVHFQGCPSPPL